MRRKRILVKLCAGVLAVSLLAGCGGREVPVSQEETIGDQSMAENLEGSGADLETDAMQEESWEPVDWMQGGYQMPRFPVGYRLCACVNTYVVDIPEPEFDYFEKHWRYYTSLGGDFYVLDEYRVDEAMDGNTQWRFQLYWLDGDTGESRVITPFWEEQGMNEWISEINAVSDHQLAFTSGAKWQGSGYKLMLWDLESGENRIWDIPQDLEEQILSHRRWMDAQGYVYVSGWPDDSALYVLGEKDIPGQLELLHRFEVMNSSEMGLSCRMPDGTPLVHMDGKLVYIDMDAGMARELASVGNYSGSEGCIDERGFFFNNWAEDIRLWNPATDEYNFMLELEDYGIRSPNPNNFFDLRIGVNRAGELMMLVEKDGDMMMYHFAIGQKEAEGTLRLANLWYNDSDVKSAAITYSIQHPDCQVTYETDWTNQEGFYERIMAQMAVGQGPDLLFVHGEDMDRLSARGLLADLTDALDEETRNQLFSGVMTAGLRDGKLAGLPAAVSGLSMLTVDANWQKDTWTFAEAAELWQQRKGQGAWRFLPLRWSQEEMLEYMILSDMSDSPFIDWENHRCDFENDLFRRMLEMIGERSVQEHTNLDIDEEYETAQQVMDGVYLADVVYGKDIVSYIAAMQYYKGEPHFVGFPTESGNGNMLKCYGFVVVNAQTEHWEEVVDFLRYMYSKEFERNHPQYLLRKDVLRECMAPSDQDNGYEVFTLARVNVPLKKDGSSYVEDYIAFMDSCRTETRSTEDIGNIIREEAGAYFQNIQDLDNTVRVIQNRVQLFLNENQ